MKNFKNRLDFCTIVLLLSLATGFILCENINASSFRKENYNTFPSNIYLFTPQEDESLIRIIPKTTSWVNVASYVGRKPRECRKRAKELGMPTVHITRH